MVDPKKETKKHSTKLSDKSKDIYIVEVLPIAKSVTRESLSYFTTQEIPLGAVVSIPLRKKLMSGVVIGKRGVSDMKNVLRSAPYEMKKISKVKSECLFSEAFMKTAIKTAEYYASYPGPVLSALISKKILENSSKIKSTNKFLAKEREPEKFVLQADDPERFANYKSLVREEFAKKLSVFFCLPTVEDVKKVKGFLEKGIELYTFVLHSLLSKKEVVEVWKKILDEKHPVLIIGTPSFLSIPRGDIGTIILDKENSRFYKMQTRPFIDMRTFAEFYAEAIESRIIYGDTLLRTETMWREKRGDILALSPLKFRSLTPAEEILIDTRGDVHGGSKSKSYSIISQGVLDAVSLGHKNNERILVFAARRGLAPNTICGDCGEIVLCKTCKAPTVLHARDNDNFFLCHRCGETRDAGEKCSRCGSWKLVTLGAGIETIEAVLKEKFPSINIFKIDKDSVKTHARALEIVQKFEKSPGSILLCTEMALNFLTEKVETVIVSSVDSLFGIPDFRISEKIFSVLLLLRSFAQKKFILQTRNPDQTLWRYAFQGNLMDFYREEIANREELKYPPFSLFIKMSLRGDRTRIEQEIKKAEEIFAEWKPLTFPAFIPEIKGKYTMHLLIRLQPDKWVDQGLLAKILELPLYWSVKVDPENLL